MATQIGLIKIKGGTGEYRGYSRKYDSKGKKFIGKKGGASKKTFEKAASMALVRANASEFQGCVNAAFDFYNFVSLFYHMRGLEFKQNLFKSYLPLIHQGGGLWGRRPLDLGNVNALRLPFQIGYNSFESLCSHKFTYSFSAGNTQFNVQSITAISEDEFHIKNNDNAFRLVISIFCQTSWLNLTSNGSKYKPLVTDTITKRNVFYGPSIQFGSLPGFYAFHVIAPGVAPGADENVFGCIGIETGNIINTIFYPNKTGSGSSIVLSLN